MDKCTLGRSKMTSRKFGHFLTPCHTLSQNSTDLSKLNVSDEEGTSNNASEKRKSLRSSTSNENLNILPNTCNVLQ